MPRRTITEARWVLEHDLAPTLNDYNLRQAREVLDELEAKAKDQAETYVAERETEITQRREVYLRELTAVRDGYDDLAGEAATGRLTAHEYHQRLKGLRERHDAAEGALAAARTRVAALAAIEADPVGWYDDLVTRLPELRPEVPW